MSQNAIHPVSEELPGSSYPRESDSLLSIASLNSTATVDELKSAVLKEPWFDALIRGKPGLMLQGGSLLGVTTQVWAVKDRIGNERALCGLEFEAQTRKAELKLEAEVLAERTKVEGTVDQNEDFRIELVWDSPSTCASASAHGFGAFTTFDKGLLVRVVAGTDGSQGHEGMNTMLECTRGEEKRADGSDAPFATVKYTVRWSDTLPPIGIYKVVKVSGNHVGAEVEIQDAELLEGTQYKFVNPLRASASRSENYRPEVAAQLARVTDALDALSTAASDTNAFVMSDWFTIGSTTSLRMASSDEEFDNVVSGWRQEPISIFNRLVRRFQDVTVVVPLHPSLVKKRQHKIRELFGEHVKLVMVSLANFSDDGQNIGEMNTEEAWGCFTVKLLAALTQAGHPDDRPRHSLNCIVAGGPGVLLQMSKCAEHGVPLLVLDGSGRLADMWGFVWPERRLATFDPVKQARRISAATFRPATTEHVAQLRTVLTKGELLCFTVNSNSAALERLTRLCLVGDQLLGIAVQRRNTYLSTFRRYEIPRKVLFFLSIAITFSSTLLALISGEYESEDMGSSKLHFVLVVLPALLVIIDSMDSFIRTVAASRAAKRATGLVEQHLCYYQTRAGGFADDILATKARQSSTDVTTIRQQLLIYHLSRIDRAAVVSGALSVVSNMASTRVDGLQALELIAGPDLEPVREEDVDNRQKRLGGISGSEYVRVRLDPALKRLSRNAQKLLVISILCHLLMYTAAAVGTVLATLGYTQWVAITVMINTLATKCMESFLIEVRRIATSKALRTLGAAKLRWQGLPREARERQEPLDELVHAVESALEATLPPRDPTDDDEADHKSAIELNVDAAAANAGPYGEITRRHENHAP